MRRRDILRNCGGAAAVGGIGLFAGCSGGGDVDEGSADLEVAGFDHGEDDSGELVVTVTVENGGNAEGSGILYVDVEAGDDITRESREVTVPAGETTTLDVEIPFEYERFRSRGNIGLDLRTD